MKIFKYPIPIEEHFELDLPVGARILSFQLQMGMPFVWAIVDDFIVREKRKFVLLATGDEIGDKLTAYSTYIGTIQTSSGVFVWHLFEIVKDRY